MSPETKANSEGFDLIAIVGTWIHSRKAIIVATEIDIILPAIGTVDVIDRLLLIAFPCGRVIVVNWAHKPTHTHEVI